VNEAMIPTYFLFCTNKFVFFTTATDIPVNEDINVFQTAVLMVYLTIPTNNLFWYT